VLVAGEAVADEVVECLLRGLLFRRWSQECLGPWPQRRVCGWVRPRQKCIVRGHGEAGIPTGLRPDGRAPGRARRMRQNTRRRNCHLEDAHARVYAGRSKPVPGQWSDVSLRRVAPRGRPP
jgi:hypothetical protein